MSEYFSPSYYVALLGERVIQEAIGDTGHLSDLSTFYKSVLAPMANAPDTSPEQVYDVIANEMMKYKGTGISPQNFAKFMNELTKINRSWQADPQKHGMYKSAQEEMISYLGYWLTSGMVGSAKQFDRKPDITRREWAETPAGPGTAKGAPAMAGGGRSRTFGEDKNNTGKLMSEDVRRSLSALTEGFGDDTGTPNETMDAPPVENNPEPEMDMAPEEEVNNFDESCGDACTLVDQLGQALQQHVTTLEPGHQENVLKAWEAFVSAFNLNSDNLDAENDGLADEDFSGEETLDDGPVVPDEDPTALDM